MPKIDKLIPVLIGADMNCYTVARAFHEEYGVPSYAFGRWSMGDTMYSKIIHFTEVPNIDEKSILVDTLNKFAIEHKGCKLVVLGCTDDYASMLIDCKAELESQYIVPYISKSLRDKLVNKADFYNLCDSYNIPYPKTFVTKSALNADELTQDKLGFSYPIIIKPSSSILYWKHPFDGMKKVYVANNNIDAQKILTEIYNAGYPDKVILQDRIPGADAQMHVLTAYCDKNAKVKMMCLGHVGLEEHTPKALGNHAAIITEYNEPLMQRFKDLLENVGYTGFANFDIKHDTRDDSYRCFEINLRQGRSNYYVTGAGENIAKLLVRDRVLCEELGECIMHKKESYWHSVPNGVVYKYVQDAEFIAKAKKLSAEGRETTSFGYKYDCKNPMRLAYTLIHASRYYKKFKTYCK